MSEQDVLWDLYYRMFRSRIFEETIARLWHEGLISGEMHLGMGEEAVCAGIDINLVPGDALALDHRGTVPLVMRGTSLRLILLELLGHPQGLCGGYGGHMHLFDRDIPAASSGIVGAAGPAGAGFALAAKYLQPGKISVAYFGEGAVNQGMLMESFNLAVAWNLPVLFVCKDNQWSITTRSPEVTGGEVIQRAAAFGLTVANADGFDVQDVRAKAHELITGIRSSGKPAFLYADCIHLEGHFLGDPLLSFRKKPLTQLRTQGLPLVKSFLMPKGTALNERLQSIKSVLGTIGKSFGDHFSHSQDPLILTREKLRSDYDRLSELESNVKKEIGDITADVLNEMNNAIIEQSGEQKINTEQSHDEDNDV